MKRFTTLFMAVTACLPLLAQTTPDDEVTFEVNQITYVVPDISKNEIAITDCKATDKVIIPETITYNETEYTVKAIYEDAFYYSDATSIELPNSIDSIGKHVFSSSKSLTSIKLPEKLKYLGRDAFSACSELLSIELPETLTGIPENAFFTCYKLNSIKFPSKLEYIGNSAFYKAGMTSVELPETCDSIGKSCFFLCPELKSIQLSSNTHFIGEGAFRGCAKLETFTIPEKIDSLDNNTLMDCSSLTSIHLPANLTKLGICVFGGTGIKSYTVDEENPSFQVIDNVVYDKEKRLLYAFPQGKSEYTIPEGVIGIWGGAFYGTEISSVVLPESMKALDESTFAFSQLSSINFPEALIYMGPTALYDTQFTDITLPKNMTLIYEGLLEYCKKLTSVTIPEKVTFIDTHAFFFDTNLTEVHCLGTTPPQVYEFYEEDESPFGYVDLSACKLYVPIGCKETYYENGWDFFGKDNIIEETTGIETNARESEWAVYEENGTLRITVQKPLLINIYDVTGNHIYEKLISDTQNIPLPKGIYLVKGGGKVHKVAIK